MTNRKSLFYLADQITNGSASTMAFEDAGLSGWAELAYHGSLDAAFALQNEVLPNGSGNGFSNWSVQIDIDGDCDYTEWRKTTVNLFDGSWHASCSTDVTDVSELPARAWLLSIVMALGALAK